MMVHPYSARTMELAQDSELGASKMSQIKNKNKNNHSKL